MIKLLVVDDEIASLKIIKHFLTVPDIEITGFAENGLEAIDLINKDIPDIIITDMQMPIMNGVSLLQYLIDCYPSIKIVVISGYYDFEYTHAAISAKVQDYILKPIAAEKLNSAIQKCCSLIQEDKKIALNSVKPETVHIDLKLYQSILKICSQLTTALETENDYQLKEILSNLYDLAMNNKEQTEFFKVAYKSLMENILNYAIEHNYDLPASSAEPDFELHTADLLCDKIQRCYAEFLEQLKEKKKAAPTEKIVEEVYSFIQEHYKEPITLEGIADLYFMNKEYLSTLFRKKYGETVGNYIIRLKIEDAKKQLIYSNRKIDDIAFSLGYQDPSYFNRQFKKTTGISPGKFRSNHMKTM